MEKAEEKAEEPTLRLPDNEEDDASEAAKRRVTFSDPLNVDALVAAPVNFLLTLIEPESALTDAIEPAKSTPPVKRLPCMAEVDAMLPATRRVTFSAPESALVDARLPANSTAPLADHTNVAPK